MDIQSPINESVVNTKDINVTGKTLPTAIVSVNGNLTPVKSDGTFSYKLTLNNGVNSIEVVASEVSGKEIGKVLTVVYQP